MSALDQAFLQAYAKNRGQQAPSTSPPRSDRGARRPYRAKAPAEAAPVQATDSYADGTWYRLESEAPESLDTATEGKSAPESVAGRRRKRLAARAPHVRFL